MNVSLYRGADLTTARWQNGGGITREIARDPQAWRVSIADIDRPGPFSRFDGIDRTLVVLDGQGLDLGLGRVMAALDIARFDGGSATEARLAAGPVRVFNVMTHRGAARAAVALWHNEGRYSVNGDAVFVHCARGSLILSDAQSRVALKAMDTVRIDAAKQLEVEIHGDGVMLYASIATEFLS